MVGLLISRREVEQPLDAVRAGVPRAETDWGSASRAPSQPRSSRHRAARARSAPRFPSGASLAPASRRGGRGGDRAAEGERVVGPRGRGAEEETHARCGLGRTAAPSFRFGHFRLRPLRRQAEGCWRAVKAARGVRAIVKHLGLPTAGARLAPARGPHQAAWS
jgi:hypothetical protein